MISKILMSVLIISQLTKPSHSSSNIQLLDMEIERWASRVWTGKLLREQDLKESLIFVYDPDKVDGKYLNSISFKSFYEKAVADVKDIDQVTEGHFPTFASLCKTLYEKTSDNEAKVGVYLLLEGVTKKHLEQVRKAKTLMAKKNTDDNSVMPNSLNSDSFDLFKRFFDGSPKPPQAVS